jgi:glycosyltransferase involved in cell wall biosynthesis
MGDTPLVSIIINCYNGEKYLRDAIDSIYDQTYQNWEIIFWDNQSTDKSAEIFKSYNDVRLKYFYAPCHTVLYEARNYAIDQAKGEFLAFLDVDDWWLSEKLEKQIPLFQNLDVGFVCSNYRIVNEKNNSRKLYRKKKIPSGNVTNSLMLDYSVGLLTLVVKRSAFNSLSFGCDPRFHIIGDMDLVMRLSYNWEMASIQSPLAYYRIHGENIGPKQRSRTVDELQIWVDELGKNKDIINLTGYKKIKKELIYLKGQRCLSKGNISEASCNLKSLPIGKFKIKLMILIVIFVFSHMRTFVKTKI